MTDHTRPAAVRVWALRRKGNGKIVTAPAANLWIIRAEVARRGHHRYEVVHADLVPTDWKDGEGHDGPGD